MSGRYKIEADQGRHLIFTVLDWKDANDAIVDTTGFTARFAINDDKNNATLIASAATSGGVDGTIVITQTPTVTNKIVVTFGPAVTALWPTDKTLFYELVMISAGGIETSLMKDRLVVSAKVAA